MQVNRTLGIRHDALPPGQLLLEPLDDIARRRNRDDILLLVVAVVAPQLRVPLERSGHLDRVVRVDVVHDPRSRLQRLEDHRARDDVNPFEQHLDEFLDLRR